jgi:alpha-L-arabinofuranosidase
VEIAVRSNLSDSFGSGVIQPGLGWLYLTPTYYSQNLYQRAAGTYPLQVERSSKTPWQLQEPDVSATLSSDGRILRVYAVNSTAHLENIHFYLDGLPSPAAGAEVTVLKDRGNAPDSEAMNSRNDPERITPTSAAMDLRGSDFPFSFAPFSVTLLEVRLDASAARR